MTRDQYDAAVTAMREAAERLGGRVEQDDFYPSDVKPYRYASLHVSCADLDQAVRVATALTGLAWTRGIHFTLHGPSVGGAVTAACSRPLAADELRGSDEVCVSFPVEEVRRAD